MKLGNRGAGRGYCPTMPVNGYDFRFLIISQVICVLRNSLSQELQTLWCEVVVCTPRIQRTRQKIQASTLQLRLRNLSSRLPLHVQLKFCISLDDTQGYIKPMQRPTSSCL
eukprot:TRINITY_DN12612_c0_g2_i10.p1 TRINITY_DN12612_c0_g2~~TRINITY_DN12612_c0_g2_i10.p1  ORF type:complete len:111 (-),score=3.13 TRINITY_DN12612_c0_g2_i10:44-376(-)